MFRKVLIANRGAIAVRIIRTLRTMDITSVVVYSDADRESLHVSQADEAYPLGAGTARETYLDQEKLFHICDQAGVDAIHPGYGFLSENPDFVQACEARNIVFLGPRPEHMQSFGLKHSARKLAADNGVPLLPGTGLLSGLESALEEAERIGYPVMLKSSAGGGGIGMELCYCAAELAASFESVQRLSQNNFGNADVFLEKFIERARHIEVQVFGDGEGQVVALGERDCSAQRRNQKVIEEAPAPNLSDEVRSSLHETAIRLCAAVAYRNAGTVEFIYDGAANEFYFLEVNTRLQVEHGVTEQVFGVDLVEWMVLLGAGEIAPLEELRSALAPSRHSIQVRVYAEDPGRDFQPSAGLVSHLRWPVEIPDKLRIDHWIETGIEVSPFFDPMLGKVIVTADTRELAVEQLCNALQQSEIYGVQTNLRYVQQVLRDPLFESGNLYTRYLNDLVYQEQSLEVLVAGTMSTIQDWPGRGGYWDVGVPPSGPFDSYSFRLGNRLLGNDESAAGIEITLTGPALRFNCATRVVFTGARMPVTRVMTNGEIQSCEYYRVIHVERGEQLKVGKSQGAGARAYLLIEGGIDCPQYLGSRATFTLGRFGGHSGRALQRGDVLAVGNQQADESPMSLPLPKALAEAVLPQISDSFELRVVYGPHGAPDFFTEADIEAFFAAEWEVHYNSSRTGIRLIGPKPEWARTDGGEAGMHPSNIHDNAYAVGSIDFTGDMPVILGPDGPSLGGFVCPATVITADLWKLGQLKAGTRVRFIPVDIDTAVALEAAQHETIRNLEARNPSVSPAVIGDAVLERRPAAGPNPAVAYRPSGDHYLLVEYGPVQLDINLRFRVHALMLWLQANTLPGMRELTPGIRSLQIHYDSQQLPVAALLKHLQAAESELSGSADLEIESRIVYLPLSWDDQACRDAVQKYMQSVRQDAPWCPDNIEFIRRINGLDSVQDVKDIVFDASYVVMGLGDVYLGAPVATPLDPRHRLVTTKYNPARTWTEENSVGIGGSYLCVYGMEGPGGYQFVGRTLQMWNRYRTTTEFSKPWLLRFFDQVRFYEVSHEELQQIRVDFPKGRYPLKIEQTRFNLAEYNRFLDANAEDIAAFNVQREAAFAQELQRWVESGQLNFETEAAGADDDTGDQGLPENATAVESHIAGNVWQVLVAVGDEVTADQPVMVLESMKMEIEVVAPEAGRITSIQVEANAQVHAGQKLMVIEVSDS